jgi:hypothetical protein
MPLREQNTSGSLGAIDLEGTEVCDWLTTKGITCVLLKYRTTDDSQGPLGFAV